MQESHVMSAIIIIHNLKWRFVCASASSPFFHRLLFDECKCVMCCVVFFSVFASDLTKSLKDMYKTHRGISAAENVKVGLFAVATTSSSSFRCALFVRIGRQWNSVCVCAKNMTRLGQKTNANPFWHGTLLLSLSPSFAKSTEGVKSWIEWRRHYAHGKCSHMKNAVCVCVSLWGTAPFKWIATWLALKT